MDAVEPAEEGFRATPRKLLIKDAQSRVVARPTDAILKIWSVLELAERSRKGVFQRVRRLPTIDAIVRRLHHFPFSQTESGITPRFAGHAPAFCAGDLPVAH